MQPSEEGTLARQSISCSRSFGQRLTAFEDLWGAVSTYLSRAAEKLRAQGDQAHLLTVFVSQDRYDTSVPPPYTRSATLTLPGGPTNDTLRLLAYGRRLLEKIYQPDRRYVKAGVVLDGLEPPGRGLQLRLFDSASTATITVPDARVQQLMHCMDTLNHRFGRGTVRPAAAVAQAGQLTPWQGNSQYRSPAYTTRLTDLLLVG
nr:DUF4113 domain-containing protein [Hymenobacter defluvii]